MGALGDRVPLPPAPRAKKLFDLSDREGFVGPNAMNAAVFELDRVPGICITKDCDYAAYVPRAELAAHCPHCSRSTVVSCLVIAGWI